MNDITAERKHRILIVDDNEANILIGTLLLGEFGYEYVAAENGFDAIEIFKSQKIALVLMDLQMPRMSGFETAVYIRDIERGEQRVPTPIIAVSANVEMGNRDLCMESGMNDFLSKPYRPEDLSAIIRMHLCEPMTAVS